MSWWPRVPAALLVVVGVLVACGDDGEPPAPATTTGPTTTEPPTTITTVDPFTVPDDPADITEAYVEAVLRELERINGDALRLALSEGMSPDVSELLLAIYTDELAAPTITVFAEQAVESFPGVREEPGDVRPTVIALRSASLHCIEAEAIFEYELVTLEDRRDHLVVQLSPSPDAGLNRTGWLYADLADLTTDSSERRLCDS